MFNSKICFFSPLCTQTVQKGHYPALLMQFILTELFCLKQADKISDPLALDLSQPYFFPYDWSQKIGSLIKVQEHALLLKYAFPELLQELNHFEKCLKMMLQKINKGKTNKFPKKFSECLNMLYQALEPFLIACNTNENLLLFLLKNRQKINDVFHPENFETLLKRIKINPSSMTNIIQKEYQNRGFAFSIFETESIIQS